MDVQATDIRPPLAKIIFRSGIRTFKLKEELDGFQAALIALAGIIIVLGIIAVIYLCFLWSKYVFGIIRYDLESGKLGF